jgi:predicted nuclease of predicted toxin-antitoxin system
MPILQPPKLYLNEHISHQIAKQLRQHGFDVISTAEANMDSVNDDVQFAYAVSEQRAIVTFNHQDFAPLHASWLAEGKEHWGVILSTEVPMNVVRQRLLKLLHSVWAEDLKNQIRWLNEFK